MQVHANQLDADGCDSIWICLFSWCQWLFTWWQYFLTCFQQMQKFYIVQIVKKLSLPHWVTTRLRLVAIKILSFTHGHSKWCFSGFALCWVCLFVFLVTPVQLYIFLNAFWNTVMGSNSSEVSTWPWPTEQNCEKKQTQPLSRGSCLGVYQHSHFWELLLKILTFRKWCRFTVNKQCLSHASGAEWRESSCSDNILMLPSCRGTNPGLVSPGGERVSTPDPTAPMSPLGRLFRHLGLTSKKYELAFFLPLLHWRDFLLPGLVPAPSLDLLQPPASAVWFGSTTADDQ